MVDLAAFAIFDVAGPGAMAYLQGLVVNQVDVPNGRVIYTPLLNAAGGIFADLTIIRLAHDHYRVVTGGGMGMRDKKWFVDHLPADGSAQLSDLTSALYTVGVWGPRARDLVQSVAAADLSNEAFPFGTAQTVDIGSVRTLMSRISYVGELGWEIYCPMEQGLRLWDTLWEAGGPLGVAAVGIGVYATTGRLEKGYRAHGAELELEYDLVEAGMARPRVKEAEFVGKPAYLEQRDRPPAAILSTLTVDDPTSKSGVKRYMLGREPILALDGSPLVNAKGRRSYVTSAGSGPSLGKHLLMSYLPPEAAVDGTKLLVEYFGERYPVTVAVAGSTPLFDPTNERIRS
jgi:glycine cleavage system aminomethyltransferase T